MPEDFWLWPPDDQEAWIMDFIRDAIRAKKRMGDFRRAMETVISEHEGGFQKRPDDPGNYTPAGEFKGTKFGISAHAFPSEDIEGLTLNRAEELYRQTYGHFAAIEDQRVLTKVLDLAVNMQWGDKGHATEILQKAIVAFGTNIAVDGIFGAYTAEGANSVVRDFGNADALLKKICDEAAQRYKELEQAHPEMKAWFDNWNSRAGWMPPLEPQEQDSTGV